jgi:hypothetical protein
VKRRPPEKLEIECCFSPPEGPLGRDIGARFFARKMGREIF